MSVSVADANVCSTLHMHLGHATLANRQDTMCFEEPDRVRRHVARQMEFASGDRGNTGFCIRSEIQIWLWDLKQESSIKLPGTAVPLLNLYYQRRKIHQVAGDGRSS